MSLPILNINVGILGHVDSGKTSLARVLSSDLSTACLDRNPQSIARGITLDLGFSAFSTLPPSNLSEQYSSIQFTLVDCPGHASLIKTIIGGAQIIDIMLLVIDATKGIQTQTAECLVLGEILTDRLIVVLNKSDLVSDPSLRVKIERGIRQTFKATKFGEFVQLIWVTTKSTQQKLQGDDKLIISEQIYQANQFDSNSTKLSHNITNKKLNFEGYSNKGNNSTTTTSTSTSSIVTTNNNDNTTASHSADLSLQSLVDLLVLNLTPPHRSVNFPFYLSVDHCFSLKGQGTILTGTVMTGEINVGSVVAIPMIGMERKVKSIQRFHSSVSTAYAGDRIGICVTQLDASLVERGIVCTPDTVKSYSSIIAVVDKIRFYKGVIHDKSKFHITIGHSTATATCHFFAAQKQSYRQLEQKQIDHKEEIEHEEMTRKAEAGMILSELRSMKSDTSTITEKETKSTNLFLPSLLSASALSSASSQSLPFSFEICYIHHSQLFPLSLENPSTSQYAILVFDHPIYIPVSQSVLLIGSKLDLSEGKKCRLAFQGRMVSSFNYHQPEEREKLKIFKCKQKIGSVEKIVDDFTLICKDLLSATSDINRFIGCSVYIQGENSLIIGKIEGGFGKGGQVRIRVEAGGLNDQIPIQQKKSNKLTLKQRKMAQIEYENNPNNRTSTIIMNNSLQSPNKQSEIQSEDGKLITDQGNRNIEKGETNQKCSNYSPYNSNEKTNNINYPTSNVSTSTSTSTSSSTSKISKRFTSLDGIKSNVGLIGCSVLLRYKKFVHNVGKGKQRIFQ